MDTEKNISVTLKQPDENESTPFLSLSTLISQVKRYFLVWIIAAVVALMCISGLVMMLKTSVSDSNITALVSFNYDGIQSGLDPKGNSFDINKIKSPNVIESALTNLGMPLGYVESVRRNISIKGIIPNEAMDKISLYQKVYSSGGSAALSAVESLLNIGYYPSYYIITLNYGGIGLDLTESKQVLDSILKSYQEYFFTTYGYNEALGNSVVAVDYKDYDYPAALDVFDATLTNLKDYVNKIAVADPDFRSNKTGYSFNDLSAAIDTLKSADLDSLSSYVVINNVTNDKELLITYYQYRIEELERKQNVYQSELNSIADSIDNYEKDTLLVFGDGAENADTSYSQASKQYDELIIQKISKQKDVSRCKQRINYFKERVNALNGNNSITSVNKEDVEERLSVLNEKITNMIEYVNQTADEYYETVTFAHAYNILVPATGVEPTVVTNDLLMPVIIGEAVIFFIYIVFVFIKSVIIDYRILKEKKN